jgi:hypothetical protein
MVGNKKKIRKQKAKRNNVSQNADQEKKHSQHSGFAEDFSILPM